MVTSLYSKIQNLLYFGVLCFDRLLPQAICSSQRLYRCSGVHMEACHNLSKNHIDARFSWGWSETQSLFSKQSINKHLLPLGALVTSEAQPEVSNTPIVGDDKTGVLLLNLGGPETLEDVQPFLFNLFADPVTSSRLFFFFVVFNVSQFDSSIFLCLIYQHFLCLMIFCSLFDYWAIGRKSKRNEKIKKKRKREMPTW